MWKEVAVLKKEFFSTVIIKDKGCDTLDWEMNVQRWLFFGMPIYMATFHKEVDYADKDAVEPHIGFSSKKK